MKLVLPGITTRQKYYYKTMNDFSIFDYNFSDFVGSCITDFAESRTNLSVFYAPDYKFNDITMPENTEILHELPTVVVSLPNLSTDALYVQFVIGVRDDSNLVLLVRREYYGNKGARGHPFILFNLVGAPYTDDFKIIIKQYIGTFEMELKLIRTVANG